MRRLGLFLAATAILLLVMVSTGIAGAQGEGAVARLKDKEGNPVGNARFTEDSNGVEIAVNVERGIEPGEHGIHIHEKGEISPDFEAAGEHFNPTGAQHGFENPQGPHSGDLENITVVEDGTASYRTITNLVTLSSGGENSLLDEDGSALVIHERPDDYETDPSGTSSTRVAAGVVEAMTGTSSLPLVTLALLAGAALLGAVIFWWVRRTRHAS